MVQRSQVNNLPTSDRITRERTFEIQQKRLDKQDAMAQIAITLDELLRDETFTGKIIVNCNSGGVNSIQVVQIQKV